MANPCRRSALQAHYGGSWWHVATRCRRAVRGVGSERSALGARLARDRQAGCQAKGGDRRSERIEAYRSIILDAIDTRADITLGEIAEMLRREHRATFAPSTVWRFLDRHAMTLKKNGARSEQDRPDVAARRKAGWTPGLSSISWLVFIDETGATTKMARVYGRAKRGKRCR